MRKGALRLLGTMLALLLITWPSAASTPAKEDAGTNLSFENGDGTKAIGWEAHQDEGEDARQERVAEGRNGSQCVLIDASKGAAACWRGEVVVQPFSTYRLRGWIKTEALTEANGKGAQFIVRAKETTVTSPLMDTQDWTLCETTFETGDTDEVEVQFYVGHDGLAKGKAWCDDIALERTGGKDDIKPTVHIDVTKTGAPLSKYIYGQFIEHLGRCIYGGIWAEMLQDRKFFYDVGTPDSPWRVYLGIKPESEPDHVIHGNVRMAPDNVYVGEHTPWVIMDGVGGPIGIMQNDLSVRMGRKYTGYVVLSGQPAAAPIDVTLVWGDKIEERQTVQIDKVPLEYKKFPFEFTAGGNTDKAHFIVAAHGKGVYMIGAVSLMPADNYHGMRSDTLALLKELDSPVYRWPGGNFVSGYNWRDGVGDRDKRPPRKNPAWGGIEHNDFGLDEFMFFCQELKTEPYIAVNSGLGGLQDAVQELEYANGGTDTPMGALRARNGHPEPYNVEWWSIGNEMFGAWQLGYMPLEKYTKKHNAFAEAMRAKDPRIKLIGVGDSGKWSETMLAECGNNMDLLSEHFYCAAKPGIIAHVRQIPAKIKEKADAHRNYLKTIPTISGKMIPIAMDEWNYWYGPDTFGELGTRYFLKDALGIAAGLHEYARNSDIFGMANYAQTVNVIGAIKTTATDASMETTGLVLKLYRKRFGTIPVPVNGEYAPLDVVAAWTESRKVLTIAVVNPLKEALDLPIQLDGAKPAGTFKTYTIGGTDPMAYNEPGKTPVVKIVEQADLPMTDLFQIPATSIVIFEIPMTE